MKTLSAHVRTSPTKALVALGYGGSAVYTGVILSDKWARRESAR